MNVEILAPASTFKKIKLAILYGANAVYTGSEMLDLRARAGKLNTCELADAVKYAHERNVKIYVTINAVPRDEDFPGLSLYLKKLAEIKVDAIIVSSLAIINLAKEAAPSLKLHLSTQASVCNSAAVKFYEQLGIQRIILAREVDLNSLKKIKKQTNIELEVFIHGGLCSSYSGRCVLSNHMAGRDANRGGCAHPCRWNYDLYLAGKKVNHNTFHIASRDLCTFRYIRKMLDVGVSSFKIEGRMKSEYYVATIVKIYREIIAKASKKIPIDYRYYRQELRKSENRLFSSGFIKGKIKPDDMLYDDVNVPNKTFIGIILAYDREKHECLLEQRNYFKVGDRIEFVFPEGRNRKMTVKTLYDINHQPLAVARHPQEKLIIKTKFSVLPDMMIRLL